MIASLTAITLALHLVCVNVASAGPIICVWLDIKEGRGDLLAGRMGRFLSSASLWLLVFGGVIGGLVGVLEWDAAFKAAIQQMPSKIHFAVWEYLFSLLLMIIHARWWARGAATSGLMRGLRCFLAILAGTNLIYHFPFLFVILSQALDGRLAAEGEIDAAAFRGLMMQSEVLARTMHFLLASFAVTGVAVMNYAMRLYRLDGEDSEDAKRVAMFGGRLALTPTLMQLLVGMWLLLKLPRVAQKGVMGGDLTATVLLGVSVVLSFWLMHQLSSISLGKCRRRAIVRCSATMLLVILLMTGTLLRVRNISRRTNVRLAADRRSTVGQPTAERRN